MAPMSSASSSSTVNGIASQNQPLQGLKPSTSHSVVPSLFSQIGVPVGLRPATATTSQLDLDGWLREWRKRRLEVEREERHEMQSNKRVGSEWNLSFSSTFSGASNSTSSTFANVNGPSIFPTNTRLKFLLEKQLTKSDVNKAGRIIIPKSMAEDKLPILEEKSGITLIVRDALSSDKWRMKYRYWPNNGSRMYVLEKSGDFIRKNNLKFGDSIAIYQNDSKQNFICAKRVEQAPFPLELPAHKEHGRSDNDGTKSQRNRRLESRDRLGSCTIKPTNNPTAKPIRGPAVALPTPTGHSASELPAPTEDRMTELSMRKLAFELPSWNIWDSQEGSFGIDDDFMDFSQHGRLPSFGDSDFSLFDSKPEEDDADKGKEHK